MATFNVAICRQPPGLAQRSVVHGDRLALYSSAADRAEFWEAHWRGNPPVLPVTGEIPSYYRRLFSRWLPRDGIVVEAGAGNGNVARLLSKAGYPLHALDFAQASVAASRAIDKEGTYLVGDVRALPYADATISGYVSLGVVEHFSADQRALILREAARALRPGGIALISTPCYGPLRRARAAWGGFDGHPADLPFYQWYFTRRDLEAQVRAVGLEPVDYDKYDIFKGIKETIGFKARMLAIRARGGFAARLLDDPPRWLRLLCGHMVMVVARRTQRTIDH
jgi:SAM-dependent methyltransferase